MIDPEKKYEVVSFDCYGTLIDWESGFISGLRPVLANHRIDLTDHEIFERGGQRRGREPS